MEHGVIERYQGDQLVVALPDLAIVQDALQDLRVFCTRKEQDGRLGLALLTLDNVAGNPKPLRGDREFVTQVAKAKWRGDPSGDLEPSDLDLLICRLRQDFQARYGGWVPTIGKNRMLAPVRGFPYVGGGGGGNPYVGGGGAGDPYGAAAGDPYGGYGGHGDPRVDAGAYGQSGSEDPRLGDSAGEWAPRATQPGHGVRVGLLDTPLDQNPWLDGGYLATARDLLPPTGSQPLPASAGHGTFVAGLILHRAPGAQLEVRPVLNTEEIGDSWIVAKIMAKFAGTGIDILNLSFGCYTDDGEPPLVLARAVSLVPEILLVAAAGNHGNIDQLRESNDPLAAPWTSGLTPKTPMWPAAFDDVVAVGATTAENKLAAFSPRLPWVDVTAPGAGVYSTYLTGEVQLAFPQPGGSATAKFSTGFARWDGTSFAAANVSGAVAAKIRPGRRDARQALNELLAAPAGDIRPFPKADRT
jgi:membrane-anchored mycosin MYCP